MIAIITQGASKIVRQFEENPLQKQKRPKQDNLYYALSLQFCFPIDSCDCLHEPTTEKHL